MSAAVEIVMPLLKHRRALLRGLPLAAHVVSNPSDRQNVARIVVVPLGALEGMTAIELIERVRAIHKDVPVVFLGGGRGGLSSRLEGWFQKLAVASSGPAESVFVAPDQETVARIIRAHLSGAEKDLIAMARVEEDQFWVWSCEPKLYRCPLDAIAPLRKLSPSAVGRFELSKSGSRLHWPDLDIDLTLESFKEIADPVFRARQIRRYRMDAKQYAKAIQLLRKREGLRQSSIQGLSDRQVRRIEAGERIPRLSTLEKLAKAHDMDLKQYMDEIAVLSSAQTE